MRLSLWIRIKTRFSNLGFRHQHYSLSNVALCPFEKFPSPLWKWESAVSHSLRPHGLHSPWNSPGQKTGVGSLSMDRGAWWLQSMGSQRVGHNWVSEHTHSYKRQHSKRMWVKIYTYSCFLRKCTYICTQTCTHTNLNRITPRCTAQNLPCVRGWGSNNP